MIIYLFNILIKGNEQLFAKNYYVILGAFMVLMFISQIVFGYILRFDPIFDLEAVYRGALEWVNTGTFGSYKSSTCYESYFYIFPNNLGCLAFLAVIFKIANIFNITDSFMVATAVNSILSVSTMCLTSLICKRLWGIRHAVVVLSFFLLSPPFYFSAAVFYTDFLSIIFPILILYIFLKCQDFGSQKKRIFFYCLIGIVAAIGMLIKFTVVITVIAIVIYLLVKRNYKQTIAFTLISAVMIGVTIISFNSYIYSNHLDKATAAQERLPYTHWIMMSLSGTGGYNNSDFDFTSSIEDPYERLKVTTDEIFVRLDKLGFTGVMNLAEVKSARCFGDGTYALAEFLDDNPQNNTIVQEFILFDGKHYKAYKSVCAGIFLSILILMVISGFKNIIDYRQRVKCCLIPQLCVFGIMLFLLMWEVNSRYINNFIPMIFISAVGGMDFFSDSVTKFLNKANNRVTFPFNKNK